MLTIFSHPRTKKVLSFILLLIIIAGSAGTGFVVGRWNQVITSAVPTSVRNAIQPTLNSNDKTADFSLFWQAWNVIDQKFYGKAEDENRVEGAISGMVASLDDPYTVYMEPSQNKLFKSDLQGSFGGIGAELTVKDGLLTVVSALEETPASKAGILGQDVILEINGKKTDGMNFNDAINTIRGEKGTDVTLKIGRKGADEPFEVKITRDIITVKSVKTESIGTNGDVAYIKVNQFGQDTVELLSAALKQANTDGKKGVLLDLRNDPGGYLEAAVSAIGMVLPETIDNTDAKLKQRTAVLERYKEGTENIHRSSTAGIIPTLPLAVLVNEGSASASEIFAGAMKDYKRATVIGTKTFGKGSVQELQDLKNGGSIKVTIAKWFTPLGNGIDGKGVEPDITVALPADVKPSTSDVQVTKALEILEK